MSAPPAQIEKSRAAEEVLVQGYNAKSWQDQDYGPVDVEWLESQLEATQAQGSSQYETKRT